MVRFTVTIRQDSRDPEKKGWSFIILGKAICNKLNPGVRKGFRVRGKLDNYEIRQTSLLPVSGECFMLPINATMRKATGKKAGDKLVVEMEVDKTKLKLSSDLLVCLKDEPAAEKFFNSLAPSHQRYFSNWVESAKTEPTRAKRIALSLAALSRQKHFGIMMRESKEENF
jgi:hypothetical protein